MTRQGYYERYFITPFFRKFSDFKGSISRRDLKFSIIAWCLATLGMAGLLIGLVGLLGPETGFVTCWVLGALWILWSIVPLLALFSRAGNSSAEPESDKPHKSAMLGIDKMLAVVCVLFFIFGLLMMTTTLNSEDLNPNRRKEVVDEENPILNQDKVVEEVIFNYKDYNIEDVPEEEPLDTVVMPEVDNNESYDVTDFDPSASTPAAQDTTYIE